MREKIILFIFLYLVWIIFSGFFGVYFLVIGALSCAATVYIYGKLEGENPQYTKLYFRPAAYVYPLWLSKEIFLSVIDVMKIVFGLKKISPKLAWVKSTQQNEIGLTAYAGSIIATPGTICTDIEGDSLQVHAINESGIDDLRRGKMDEKIRRVTA